MHPDLVKIPFLSWPIQSYGTVIVLAFLLAAWWASRRTVRDLGLPPPTPETKLRPQDRVFNAAFVVLFVGLLGARLVFAFGKYREFAARPMSVFAIWEGGLVGYGGLVAGLLWLAWWLPRQAEKESWLEGKGFALFDVLARAACLAFAVGWIAPLLAGDDFGKATTLPWGIPVSWFQSGTPVAGAVVENGWDVMSTRLHPVQVYESLFALALFVALTLVARRKPVPGRVAALFLLIHPVGHALLDTLRGDGNGRGMLVPDALSWTQFLAIPVFFTGVAIWLIRRPSRARTHATPPHAPAPR